MLQYAIEPKHKKSIEEVQYWSHEELGITISITETWRWGRYYINVDSEDDLPINISEDDENWYKHVTYLHDYDYELDYNDDGCGTYFEVAFSKKDMTDDEKYEFAEKFEERFWEDYYMGIEEDGWQMEDNTEIFIIGPLEITKLAED